MPENKAAWLVTDKANPLEVLEAPYTAPKENEIIVKCRAIAMNPVDYFIQDMGSAIMPNRAYPNILGGDVAGEVAELGSSVRNFQLGDRVLGFARGLLKDNAAPEGAFQEYVVIRENLASKLPDSMSFESASVIPLCYMTAATCLFHKTALALKHPSLDPKSTGKTLLIWGGSTSVGCNAIQLAVAAGYEVFSTASPANFDMVKSLGATKVFDYKSPTVVEDLINAFEGKDCAGAVAIGVPANEPCINIIDKVKGTKFVALTNFPVPENLPGDVNAKFILGSDEDELSNLIFVDFLPKALAEGKFVAVPKPEVVGNGLQYVQEALNRLKAGVSAKKMVVTL